MNADIRIAVLDPRWRRSLARTEAVVRQAAVAALESSAGGPIAIALGDDAMLRELNRDFRGLDKPTNVLSFAAGPGAGDVALAFETCRREARRQRKSFARHVRHLVVHGTLHLRGFDHETAGDAFAMEARERRVLRRLGLPDPYVIRSSADRPAA